MRRRGASYRCIHSFVTPTMIVAEFDLGVTLRNRTDGKLHQVDLIRDYLRWLKDAGRRRANQSAAANRLAEARAEEIEQRIAARSATLMRSSDAVAVLREIFAVVQSEFVGLPARATKDLALRRKLGDALDAALTRCAEKIDAFAANANLDTKPATRKRASRREAQIRG